ncbi:MAG: hypothetical protein AAF629_08490 [Chloroflexota bacterium]
MDGKREQIRYQSYLLRIQQINDFDRTVLRYTLEEVVTRKRYTFTSAQTLCQFLDNQLKQEE